jgi:hypothetical protein
MSRRQLCPWHHSVTNTYYTLAGCARASQGLMACCIAGPTVYGAVLSDVLYSCFYWEMNQLPAASAYLSVRTHSVHAVHHKLYIRVSFHFTPSCRRTAHVMLQICVARHLVTNTLSLI